MILVFRAYGSTTEFVQKKVHSGVVYVCAGCGAPVRVCGSGNLLEPFQVAGQIGKCTHCWRKLSREADLARLKILPAKRRPR